MSASPIRPRKPAPVIGTAIPATAPETENLGSVGCCVVAEVSAEPPVRDASPAAPPPFPVTELSVGVGAGVAVGVGVAVGAGVAVGVGVATDVGAGVGVAGAGVAGVGVGVDVTAAVVGAQTWESTKFPLLVDPLMVAHVGIIRVSSVGVQMTAPDPP
jgi:hypothetical protein